LSYQSKHHPNKVLGCNANGTQRSGSLATGGGIAKVRTRAKDTVTHMVAAEPHPACAKLPVRGSAFY